MPAPNSFLNELLSHVGISAEKYNDFSITEVLACRATNSTSL